MARDHRCYSRASSTLPRPFTASALHQNCRTAGQPILTCALASGRSLEGQSRCAIPAYRLPLTLAPTYPHRSQPLHHGFAITVDIGRAPSCRMRRMAQPVQVRLSPLPSSFVFLQQLLMRSSISSSSPTRAHLLASCVASFPHRTNSSPTTRPTPRAKAPNARPTHLPSGAELFSFAILSSRTSAYTSTHPPSINPSLHGPGPPPPQSLYTTPRPRTVRTRRTPSYIARLQTERDRVQSAPNA